MWPTFYIPGGQAAQPTYYELTTPMYPIEADESADSSAVLIRGGLWMIPQDFADTSASFVSGELRTLLKSGWAEPDSVDSSAAFVSGELRTLLKSGWAEPDSVDSSAAFVSGELRTLLIIYDNWPLVTEAEESVSTSASFVSGALT